MARYTGPRARRMRLAGKDLELFSSKRPIEKKCKFDTRPGRSMKRRGRTTEYGVQLEMKQSIKDYYGILERQFKNYYHKAGRMSGSKSDNLMLLLERRLDNIVYRMGFAPTRRAARQLVSHGHVKVKRPNATEFQRVDIPSYLIEKGSEIALSQTAMSIVYVMQSIESSKVDNPFNWLEVTHDNGVGRYVADPELDFLHANFKANLVVELYSK